MELHVGTSALGGGIEKYAARFDLVELRAEPGRLPRASKLSEMRRTAGPDFVFSIVLPRSVSSLEQKPGHESDLAYALDAANALSAQWIVLRTEASVMPSARTRRRLSELVASLGSGRRIAWEPSGVWEEEEAIALAAELEAHLVRDASREEVPPDEIVYTRLRALGRTSLSIDALELCAERIVECETACVVIEGEGVARAAKSLREMLSSDSPAEEGVALS